MSSQVQTHVITGWPEQVYAALQRADADGRLVDFADVTPLVNGQVRINADLRENNPQASRWRMRLPSPRALAMFGIGAAGTALAIGVVWAIVALITTAVTAIATAITTASAWLSMYWPALIIIAAGLFLLAAGGAKKCAGLHCSGCRR